MIHPSKHIVSCIVNGASFKIEKEAMGMLTTEEIIAATGGRIIHGGHEHAVFTGVSIDSRTIKEGDLFIALKGQRFDGHDFLADAMRKGNGAIVSAPTAVTVKGKTVLQVKDTLKALQDIAHSVRMKKRITVIGITGTNGKTTTKELIASILEKDHKVIKTSGNLNNHIGLPLSLLRVDDGDEFAVLEMGASLKGDIKQLCDIADPDYGVITNIGPGHLEGFGSLEGVRSAKLELFDSVRTIVVNGDDDFLMEGILQRSGRGGPDIITFGITSPADVRAEHIVFEERRSVFNLCMRDGKRTEVAVNAGGKANIYNALAAASVCSELGTGITHIKKGIESFAGVPMRLEIKELFGATVISDVYNANPASMKEAVNELVRLKKNKAIAVLGDMLELGAYAEEEHRKLGKWMSALPVDFFIAMGPMMARAAEEFSANNGLQQKRAVIVENPSEARRAMLNSCSAGDTVLVKGSRGMRMEKVLEEDHEIPSDLPARRRNAI